MLFLNVYYTTLCKLHEKHLILSEVKNWQVCYLGVVTLAVAHYIANFPYIFVYIYYVLHLLTFKALIDWLDKSFKLLKS
jgi:hypothetical protein